MQPPDASSVLIIGIGNPDCGDDAAGRAVAARIQACGRKEFRVMESHGEASALLSLFAHSDHVILVDAAFSGAKPGTVAHFDVRATPLPTARFGVSTHGFGLAEAVELGRALNLLPRRCEVFAIEAESCETGRGLSPEVEGAVAEVAARILADLEATSDA